jgi:preprotein translocase subunit SecA
MPDRAAARAHLTLAPVVERRVERLWRLDQLLHEAMPGMWLRIGAGPRQRARLDAIERAGAAHRTMPLQALVDAGRALRPRLLRDDVRGPAVDAAFALIREVTGRLLGKRHHRVQLEAGLAMIEGRLAEMRTGEGKTLTALLPAISYALSGRPVHVVTVNDYLAKRDADLLQPVYAAFGLTIGIVQAGQSSDERRQIYAADVVYSTNKELVFDYLRDRIALRSPAGPRSLLLRGLAFAIVDEADSVLIDEAQTPLLVAAERQRAEPAPPYSDALRESASFREGREFTRVGHGRQIELTAQGRRRCEACAARWTGVWRAERAAQELLRHALAAVHVFMRDRDYIVTDGKVQIVDEFTGRVLSDRSWQLGLHQAIEVKEGLSPSAPRETLAQLTLQRFFRRYVRLAGMSGTAREVAGELRGIYGLSVCAIPTHRPSRLVDRGCRLHATASAKWAAVVAAVAREVAAGRPVLVGTRSVAASERIAAHLAEAGIAHVVLNARQDAREAETVAEAGRAGRVTVATNMAGRGTDIHLGAGVAAAGGLHVILTEYHESARIDRQLIGRAGRQGDPGSYEIIASLEDDLFVRFAPLLRSWPTQLATHIAPRLAQSAAGRAGRRLRRQIVARDQSLDRAFFFAGRPD